MKKVLINWDMPTDPPPADITPVDDDKDK